MIALVSVFVVVLVSLLVTRIATVALSVTGLSREMARFQARSAFTGVGYTTSETEAIVNHPVRRRIVMLLMLLGNAGIVTVIASLMLSFVGTGGRQTLVQALVLVGGLLVLWLLAQSSRIDRYLSRLIARALTRWTDLDARDYAGLLHLAEGYAVMELQAQEGDWLASRPLRELDLREEGVTVLGIHRPDGTWVGSPGGATVVRPGDTLVVYGRRPRLCELDDRPAGEAGDRAHAEAVAGG